MLTSEADEIVEMKFTFWLLIVFSNPEGDVPVNVEIGGQALLTLSL